MADSSSSSEEEYSSPSSLSSCSDLSSIDAIPGPSHTGESPGAAPAAGSLGDRSEDDLMHSASLHVDSSNSSSENDSCEHTSQRDDIGRIDDNAVCTGRVRLSTRSKSSVPRSARPSHSRAGGKAGDQAKTRRDCPVIDLYPKSLSLLGISKPAVRNSSCSPVRRCRSQLTTRLARRSSSLQNFVQLFRNKIDLPKSAVDLSELYLLNRAVYEAWYFKKSLRHDSSVNKHGKSTRGVLDRYKTPRRLPRAVYKRSERVKMRVDREDGAVWEWLCEKLRLQKLETHRKQQEVNAAREEKNRKQAEQKQVAAAAFNAWKNVKDDRLKQQKLAKREAVLEQKAAKTAQELQKKEDAKKVYSAYLADVNSRMRHQCREELVRQSVLRHTRERLLAERQCEASAVFESWLHRAGVRSVPATAGCSGGRSAPWYPAGAPDSLHYRRQSAVEEPCGSGAGGVVWRPPIFSSTSAGRDDGSAPCGQHGCCLCVYVESTRRVSGERGRSAGARVRGRLCCTSRHCLYVVQCQVCSVQYVGVSGARHSLRHHLLPLLRSIAAGISRCRLARHLYQHVQQNELPPDVALLSPPFVVTPVRVFPESSSRGFVQERRWNLIRTLSTQRPYGLNSPKSPQT